MPPAHRDRYPPAPVGGAAAALVLAAAALGQGGLLRAAATPSPATAAAVRVAGLVIAAAALGALAGRSDVGVRRLPAVLGTALAVAAGVALLTLPVSDVTWTWPEGSPSVPEVQPFEPAPSLLPPEEAAPPVLRLPAGGRLQMQADEFWLVFPDGHSELLGPVDGGDGATPLPGLTLDLELAPDGRVVVVDGETGAVTDLPATGPGLDLGDVRLENDAGGALVEVDDGTVTDTGGVAGGEVEVVPVEPDRGGGAADFFASGAGIALGVAVYWLVFLRVGRRRPPQAKENEGGSPAEPARARADPAAAEAGLAATLAAMLADPDPRTAIVGAYARLLAALEAAGMGRQPQEAPHEHLHRVLEPLGADAVAVHDLADLFVLARFTDATLTPDHRQAAIDALGHALADLRGVRV